MVYINYKYSCRLLITHQKLTANTAPLSTILGENAYFWSLSNTISILRLYLIFGSQNIFIWLFLFCFPFTIPYNIFEGNLLCQFQNINHFSSPWSCHSSRHNKNTLAPFHTKQDKLFASKFSSSVFLIHGYIFLTMCKQTQTDTL